MIIHNPILTGSFSVNGADLSTITGSVATSASFDARTTYLESTSSILTAASASQSVTSGSLVAASASLSATSGSLSAASGSFNTRVSALEVTGSALSSSLLTVSGSGYATSGSLNTRVSALEVTGSALSSSLLTVSGSGYATSASLSAASGSFNSRVASLETYSTNLTAKTASFATTGSNTFIGSQTISGSVLQSGSFTSTGTLTAQTLVVQTITSSVVYSSGSNIFGNAIGNTQTFTGSVLVTGSLTISTGGNASAPIIFGSTIACSPIGCFATSCATSFIGGTLSGTTIYGSTAVCSPVGKFSTCIDAGSGIFSSSVTAGADITANDTSVGSTFLYLKGNATTGVTGVRFARANTGAQMGKIDYDFGTDLMTFRAGGNDRMYLTSGGCIGIGTTSPSYLLDVNGTGRFSGNVLFTQPVNGTDIELTLTSKSSAGNARSGKIKYDADTEYLYLINEGTNALTIASTGAATFSSTITGTTIYGSTAVCSPVGKFTTCLTFGDWTTAANVLSSNKPNEQGAYIRAAVSSAEYPTYTFEDDRDTGMYRDSANSLAFATSGSSRIQISATGDSLFNGAITIQGACSSRICLIKAYSGSPSNPGFVITDANGVLTFNHNANGGGTSISGVTCIGSNFCVAGASYFAGNVSIGTTSNLTSGAYSSIRLGTIANWWAGNGVSSGDFYLQGNSYYNGSSLRYIRTDAATEYSQVSGVHAWSTAASGTTGCSITMVERMRISNTGLVGIGTINPDYNLVICCSGQVIANVRTNSTTGGSEAGLLITTPDSIGLLTVGASDTRGLFDACRCDMVMGLRTGGKIRFSTDVNANTTQVSIANGITSFTCQMCAPYAIFNGTAAVTLPVGTTAQRTGPSTGMIRFNSSCTELEYYNGNDWLFFTSTPQSQGYYADVLVIAGGGGGGGAEASNGYGGGGAGGGAGGYMAGRIFINYTNCGYPISIGGGGTGGANEGQSTGSGCNGTTGTASCALGLVAIGGGFGAGDETGTGGGNGGSGGGNGGDNTGTQGCGTLGQGCAGGYANTRLGGGGGGASTTGCHGYGGSGAGGQGRAWYNGTTYAGGGGGGAGSAVTSTQSGGAGGGGNGSSTNGTSGAFQSGGTATTGTANTGGGGGAGAAGRAQGGQNGGSGIVIVRYYGSQKGFGGTVTSSGGYTYHSFTTSGTYCATYY